MNSFATIVKFKEYKKVTYYTVYCEEQDITEADDFFDRMILTPAIKPQLDCLVRWIEEIGDRGALDPDLFRPEGIFVALPPKKAGLKGGTSLRLYCYRVSPNVIILYSGDVKTQAKAQNCEYVGPKFADAKKWTKALKKIGVATNGKEITNIEDLNFEY